MDQFLWLGTALGAVLGVLHAVHLYRQRAARVLTGGPGRQKAESLYYGLWAFALWTVFGAYVLGFWILGSVGLGISRLLSGRRTA